MLNTKNETNRPSRSGRLVTLLVLLINTNKNKFNGHHNVEVEALCGSPAPLIEDVTHGAAEASLEKGLVLGGDGGQLGADEVNVPGEGGEHLGGRGEGDQGHVLQPAVGLYPGQQLGHALGADVNILPKRS